MSSINMKWPSFENGEEAKLYLPRHWPGGEEEDATCAIRFDSSTRLLQVVNAKNGLVVDNINPNDVVGCEVRIETIGEDESNLQEGAGGVLNCACDNEPSSPIPIDTQATAILSIYAYARKDPVQESWLSKFLGRGNHNDMPNPTISSTPSEKRGPRVARHRQFQVVASEDFANVSALIRAIRQVAGLPAGHRRALVIVNPKAGAAKGEQVFESTVKPMMEQAGVDIELFVTTGQNHAQERMQEPDVCDYDAVVAIGGDGILHEIFQGVHSRKDKDRVLEKLKVGVVGTGTGNGLAKSITHASGEIHSFLESTFLIARGQASPMDLSHYTGESKSYTSFLTFTWAMIAEVDLESEVIRFLGSLRLDLWAAWRVLSLRTYKARLSFLPPSKAGDSTKALPSMPSLSEPVPSDWQVIDDTFILFWAAQHTHAAVNTFNSPPSKLSDGLFQILVIRAPCSRFTLAKILLALDGGNHVSHDAAEFIECVAYRLEPISQGSYNDLDGERIEDGPIQASVLPSVVQVFCNNGRTQ